MTNTINQTLIELKRNTQFSSASANAVAALKGSKDLSIERTCNAFNKAFQSHIDQRVQLDHIEAEQFKKYFDSAIQIVKEDAKTLEVSEENLAPIADSFRIFLFDKLITGYCKQILKEMRAENYKKTAAKLHHIYHTLPLKDIELTLRQKLLSYYTTEQITDAAKAIGSEKSIREWMISADNQLSETEIQLKSETVQLTQEFERTTGELLKRLEKLNGTDVEIGEIKTAELDYLSKQANLSGAKMFIEAVQEGYLSEPVNVLKAEDIANWFQSENKLISERKEEFEKAKRKYDLLLAERSQLGQRLQDLHLKHNLSLKQIEEYKRRISITSRDLFAVATREASLNSRFLNELKEPISLENCEMRFNAMHSIIGD